MVIARGIATDPDMAGSRQTAIWYAENRGQGGLATIERRGADVKDSWNGDTTVARGGDWQCMDVVVAAVEERRGRFAAARQDRCLHLFGES